MMDIDSIFKLIGRDYNKHPLKRGECISKECLKILYIDLNLTQKQISMLLHRNENIIRSYLKTYNLSKTHEQILETSRQTNLTKYGTVHPNQSDVVKKKYQQTISKKGWTVHPKLSDMELYGTDKTLTKQEKIKITVKNRYGCDYYFQSSDFSEKCKQTNLEKYGVANPMQCDNIKQKVKDTCLKRYGVSNGGQTSQSIEKAKMTLLEKYGAPSYCESEFYDKDKEMTKRKNNNILKYGVEYPIQLDEVKQKQRQTVMNKYGVSNVTQLPEIHKKIHNTMKLNGSYKKSKGESYILEKLKERYDVITQYKSDVYPFYCDFYIPEKDLYIEYQGYQGHGGHAFDENNPLDIDKLNYWKSQESIKLKDNKNTQYTGYIYIWTISDPLKRQTVKDNNLNWLEFFTLQQFNQWYNNMTL